MNEQEKKNKETAQKYANSKGYKNIQELNKQALDLMNDEDITNRQIGERLAQQTVQDLVALMLRQELIDSPLPDYMNITERVFDGYMTEGNAKEYNVDLDTGITTFNDTQFIPTEQTLQQLESYFLQIYDGKKQLNPKAYQFKKEQTIPKNEWLPYFKKQELNKFISFKQASLNRAYKIFAYNKLCEIIASPKGKVINSNANNLFDAILELVPEIDKMKQYNSSYNIDTTTKNLHTVNDDDLLIFCSTKTRSAIINGIKSQTFNAQFLGPEGKTLNYHNLKFLGTKIQQTTQDNINTEVIGDEWIDDNTIIVIELSKIKHIVQVNTTSEQFFAKNQTLYLTSDIWGVMDILPWAKKLIFKCPNLLKIPSQIKE